MEISWPGPGLEPAASTSHRSAVSMQLKLGLNASVDWLLTSYRPTVYQTNSLEDVFLFFIYLPVLLGAEKIKACAKLSLRVSYSLDF
jgi:hypothetical protein